MKRIIIALVVLMMIAPTIFASPNQTNESTLVIQNLDLESAIAEGESAKTTGIWMTIGGYAGGIAGWYLFMEEDEWGLTWPSTMSYLTLATGSIVGIIGSYKWYSASQEVSMLKAKRYSFSVSPSVNATGFGVSVNIKGFQ